MTTQTISETKTVETSLADSKQIELYTITGRKRNGMFYRGTIISRLSKTTGDFWVSVIDRENNKRVISIAIPTFNMEEIIAQYIEAKAKLSKENE